MGGQLAQGYALMAIEAYTGMPGDGKTYEAVKSVILPAIKRGQRVVTNIRGLNPEKIGEHLGVPAARVRALIKEFHIDDALGTGGVKPEFFPTEGGNDDGILEWGAYNVIDEAHFIFGTGSKFDNRGKYFLRQHRHENVDDQSTQIVLITQSIDDLTSSVRNVVRATTRCIKKTMYGRHKSYYVRKFNGATEVPSKLLNEDSHQYVEPFISMYQTQRGKVGNEKGVDNRGSIWQRKKLWYMVATVLLATALIGYKLVTFNDSIERTANLATGGKASARRSAETGQTRQMTGNQTCASPIVLTEISETGMLTHFIDANGELLEVPFQSVSGPSLQRVSTVCP